MGVPDDTPINLVELDKSFEKSCQFSTPIGGGLLSNRFKKDFYCNDNDDNEEEEGTRATPKFKCDNNALQNNELQQRRLFSSPPPPPRAVTSHSSPMTSSPAAAATNNTPRNQGQPNGGSSAAAVVGYNGNNGSLVGASDVTAAAADTPPMRTPLRTPKNVLKRRLMNSCCNNGLDSPSSTVAAAESDNRILGTPDYLAPELLLRQPHSAAVDWWGLGVCLYEFLTGIPPFTDQTPEAVFDNILALRIEWPSADDGDEPLSEAAVQAVTSLLASDPGQRVGFDGLKELRLFEDVDWTRLQSEPAPFVPQPNDETDTGYFEMRNDLQHWTVSQFTEEDR